MEQDKKKVNLSIIFQSVKNVFQPGCLRNRTNQIQSKEEVSLSM